LELFTYSDFQEEVSRLQRNLNPYDPKAKRLFRKLTQANIVELDASDRILIPAEQRSMVNIDKDIVLLASGKFIEVWDSETYKSLDEDEFDYISSAEQLLGNLQEVDCNKD
jgi:MraZ protein